MTAAEFEGPVGYATTWTWAPLLLVALVVAYYVYVWKWAGQQDTEPTPYRSASTEPKEKARAAALTALDRIDAQVRQGRVPVRTGFQQLSAAVRGFVEEVTDVPARAMTLTELREASDPQVAEAIATMYPPEFEPGETEVGELEQAVRQARELVRSWT